jgi:hypothetical protein
MSQSSAVEPIKLTFGSTEKVEVIVDDRHRWLTTVHEAAQACKTAFDIGMWGATFEEFLFQLQKWCEKHGGFVSKCFVTWGDGGLHVFVVTKGDEFQFDFHDELASLDVHLAEAYPDHPADVMQLPERPAETLLSFFAPMQSIQVYGQ